MPPLCNFGRNQRIVPTACYEPRDEGEVLAILDRHRGEQIRAIGRLHSWSEAPVGQGVILDLKHLWYVLVQGDGASVVVGAGCQIKDVLYHLKQSGRTLPSVGLITQQTVAGAVSTGTHGSGRHSLSQYVKSVRVARYDAATGMPVVEVIDSGTPLEAARCSLGGLGIILDVTLQCRQAYSVEEHFHEYTELADVLKAEEQYPLQQFFFIPWRWSFIAQHRREMPPGRSRLAWLYRLYFFITFDLNLHLLILLALRLLGSFRIVQFLFRRLVPAFVIRDWKVIDDSAAMLVMRHELFRHLEMELFVPLGYLAESLQLLRDVLTAAGMPGAASEMLDGDPQREALRNCYVHHYPICVRRVLPEETLISMASGGSQDWYALSLITYARPSEREGFVSVMEYLAETLSRRCGARPHWGKLCPLPAGKLVALYPRFGEFRAVCTSRDPAGVFRNDWIQSLFADFRSDREAANTVNS